MPRICGYAAPTHWVRHHSRGLQALALEELRRDAKAYLVLAEHAAASWRVLPRYVDTIGRLHQRLREVQKRLPEGLKQRELLRAC